MPCLLPLHAPWQAGLSFLASLTAADVGAALLCSLGLGVALHHDVVDVGLLRGRRRGDTWCCSHDGLHKGVQHAGSAIPTLLFLQPHPCPVPHRTCSAMQMSSPCFVSNWKICSTPATRILKNTACVQPVG